MYILYYAGSTLTILPNWHSTINSDKSSGKVIKHLVNIISNTLLGNTSPLG